MKRPIAVISIFTTALGSEYKWRVLCESFQNTTGRQYGYDFASFDAAKVDDILAKAGCGKLNEDLYMGIVYFGEQRKMPAIIIGRSRQLLSYAMFFIALEIIQGGEVQWLLENISFHRLYSIKGGAANVIQEKSIREKMSREPGGGYVLSDGGKTLTVDLADGKLALARVGAMNGLLLGYSWEYVLEYVGLMQLTDDQLASLKKEAHQVYVRLSAAKDPVSSTRDNNLVIFGICLLCFGVMLSLSFCFLFCNSS